MKRSPQVAHHLVHLALAHELAQHGAHSLLALVHGGGEITHPRRIEASSQNQRSEFAREGLIGL